MDKRITNMYKQSALGAGISEGMSAVELIMSMLFLITVAASIAGHLILKLCFGSPDKTVNVPEADKR